MSNRDVLHHWSQLSLAVVPEATLISLKMALCKCLIEIIYRSVFNIVTSVVGIESDKTEKAL